MQHAVVTTGDMVTKDTLRQAESILGQRKPTVIAFLYGAKGFSNSASRNQGNIFVLGWAPA